MERAPAEVVEEERRKLGEYRDALRRLGDSMNFRQAEDYLLSLELFGMRFGLDRMHRLMTVLDLPQRRFASVHVVGTNGKSSTVRFCAAMLERHGLRSGQLHLAAPALLSGAHRGGGGAGVRGGLRGRGHARRGGRGDGQQDGRPDNQVTQFEALTATAYHELARRGVEVAVIEAGLGGRFDATNVIPSKVQVLTSVGPRAHPLARAHARGHRRGEAGRGG